MYQWIKISPLDSPRGFVSSCSVDSFKFTFSCALTWTRLCIAASSLPRQSSASSSLPFLVSSTAGSGAPSPWAPCLSFEYKDLFTITALKF